MLSENIDFQYDDWEKNANKPVKKETFFYLRNTNPVLLDCENYAGLF